MDEKVRLLPLGAMARKLGVTTAWLRAEAENNNLPHLKAGDRYLFEPNTVISLLIERARRTNERNEVCTA